MSSICELTCPSQQRARAMSALASSLVIIQSVKRPASGPSPCPPCDRGTAAREEPGAEEVVEVLGGKRRLPVVSVGAGGETPASQLRGATDQFRIRLDRSRCHDPRLSLSREKNSIIKETCRCFRSSRPAPWCQPKALGQQAGRRG